MMSCRFGTYLPILRAKKKNEMYTYAGFLLVRKVNYGECISYLLCVTIRSVDNPQCCSGTKSTLLSSLEAIGRFTDDNQPPSKM